MAPPSTVISKLKVSLKLSISRLRMVQQKEAAIAKMNRRALAQILESGKFESARIRVENIIREDINVELLEILELYCELLLARIGLMEAKECDPGLEEAVKSIIYAAPRTDIKEVQQVRNLLVEKYGKEFALVAIDNLDGKVAERVSKKLRVEPPSKELVELYLQEIAKAYHVAYQPAKAAGAGGNSSSADADTDDNNDQPGSGALLEEEPLAVVEEELSHATPPKKINLGPRLPLTIAPPSPSTENVRPQVKLPDPVEPPKFVAQKKAPAGPAAKKDTGPDFDELSKRFAALKKIP